MPVYLSQLKSGGVVIRDENTDVSNARLIAQATTYDLAQEAIARALPLSQVLPSGGETVDLALLASQGHLDVPMRHPEPARMYLCGTGLTHTGSASTRNSMHAKSEGHVSDSMKMFQLGLEGGKPNRGTVGAQPEWFYKGPGSEAVAHGDPLISPDFALDGGEEPEIAGFYLIGLDGTPCRVGFALANEFSDHVTERQNYLYLAHSKLRACSMGPELLLGDLPSHVEGMSRVYRDGKVIWEKPFVSGEDNMSHSLANLEYHHFKYDLFCRPGDVHAHFFGTATLSFADGITTQDGDQFEIEAAPFGRALRNRLKVQAERKVTVKAI